MEFIPMIAACMCMQSTLLQCLLDELQPIEGSVQVNGRVSYASQDPWVFSATLRENVLFGTPYDKEWYSKVIRACALDKVSSYFVCAWSLFLHACYRICLKDGSLLCT